MLQIKQANTISILPYIMNYALLFSFLPSLLHSETMHLFSLQNSTPSIITKTSNNRIKTLIETPKYQFAIFSIVDGREVTKVTTEESALNILRFESKFEFNSSTVCICLLIDSALLRLFTHQLHLVNLVKMYPVLQLKIMRWLFSAGVIEQTYVLDGKGSGYNKPHEIIRRRKNKTSCFYCYKCE